MKLTDLPKAVREALKKGLLPRSIVEAAYAKAKAQAERLGESKPSPEDILLEIQLLQEKPLQPKIQRVRLPTLEEVTFPPYEEWEFGRGCGEKTLARKSKTAAPSSEDVEIDFALAAQELIALPSLGDPKRVRNTYQSLTDFLVRIGMAKFLRVEAVVTALPSFSARELLLIRKGITQVLEKRLKDKG